MASKLPRDFMAEGAHEEAPVEELERILDLYDQAVEDLPDEDEVVALEAREQFVVDFTSFRESRLRGALEEVAWKLEQRGHHAWLEDAATGSPAGVAEIAGAAGSRLSALVLCIVPADHESLRSDPPRIAFIPDVERTRVTVRTEFGALGQEQRRIGRFSLDELDDRTIVNMTVQLIGSVLVGGAPPENMTVPALAGSGAGRRQPVESGPGEDVSAGSASTEDQEPKTNEWVHRIAEARRREELAEAEDQDGAGEAQRH